MRDEQSDVAGYLGWFLLGGVLGAAAALLMAPRSGRETREFLAEHGREFLAEHGGDVARRAQELATEAQDRAGALIDKSRELFEEQTQRLLRAFEEGKEAMREEMRRGASPPPTPRG